MELATVSYQASTGWSQALPSTADGPRTLVLAFGSATLADDPRPLVELARAFPRSHLMGCSSSGNIVGEHVSDDGLVATIARFARTDLAWAVAAVTGAGDSLAAGRSIAGQLARPGLRAVFVLADGLVLNGSELVRGITGGVGPDVRVTGGLAGDGDRFRRTWVYDGGAARGGVVTAVGMYGEALRVGHGSAGGWDPFGPERRITRSVGNVVLEIDGQPALALYKRYLGERAGGLPATGLLFPLAVRAGADDANRLVRTIVAGDVPTGHLAQLMRANLEHLLDGATIAAGHAVDSAGPHGGPALTVAISCVGRRLVLGERAEEELEAVAARTGGAAGQVGFYSYGEICPHSAGGGAGAGIGEFHNQTMTVTRFAEAAGPVPRDLGRMHPTLARQLRRLGLDGSVPPPTPAAWSRLLDRVGTAYTDADNDRYTTERAIAIGSAELAELHGAQLARVAADAARQLAEQASDAKSQFLASMSHEIRTPLNGVIGMADLLGGTPLSPEQAQFTRVLRTSADALLGVINQIMDFSKIEAGKLDLESTPLELEALLRGVVEMLARQAKDKGLTLTAELAADVPRHVCGDPVRLRQVLINLVNNAVKFTESGRVAIRVTTAPANGCNAELRFEVADTGPGIPPDRIGRLFKSFSQIDASTTRRHGGTGLGLAISARLATLMGGRTGVDSTVGVGSTFWFTVTVEAAGESAGTDRSDPTEPATIARAGAVAGELPPGLRVLVAEDNEVNQEVVAHLLARMGCLATVVGDGQAAVDVMSANPDGFDLVLMDCQMPVLDGFAAATEIRRWEAMGGRTRSLPILALTASAIVGDRDRCLAAGMDGYVTKPIQPLELRDALITLVRPKRTAAAA
jgi:signal transduction histidine kinase/CheY-like chemotaxis protein